MNRSRTEKLRVPLSGLSSSAKQVPGIHCWTSQQWHPRSSRGLTLVEMLVSMAITLLIMAAVVTVFANITGSVNRRRATIEMAGALRGVREALSRDMENATCPALPWRHPEANEGYIEIIEGPQNDYYPSVWLYDGPDSDNGVPEGVGSTSPTPAPRIDLSISSLPGSNLRGPSVSTDEEGRGLAVGSNEELPESAPTDGRGLGDADDVLMLTVRNELQPFVGRVPPRTGTSSPSQTSFPFWDFEEIESPLAEVAWFSIENPPERSGAETFAFGEAGYRTVYRRVLMIAPWLDYNINVGGTRTGPGVVRVLNDAINDDEVHLAIASLIAFQDRFDLSVRLEWDPLLPGNGSNSANGTGRWVLKANSLADLTKRENRFEHHGLTVISGNRSRRFPFAALSAGGRHTGGANVTFVLDPEYAALPTAPTTTANYEAITSNGALSSMVVAYEADPNDTASDILENDRQYPVRPLAFLDEDTLTPATARAILNEDGSVVRVVRGLAPLGGARRGDDVMLTDVMAFDLRVYDPGAPVYGYYPGGNQTVKADTLVQPGDPAWAVAFQTDVPRWLAIVHHPAIKAGDLTTATTAAPYAYERSGAYVDLGYAATFLTPTSSGTWKIEDQFAARVGNPVSRIALGFGPQVGQPELDFFEAVPPSRLSWLEVSSAQRIAPHYPTYDTWSWHYENNGLDEDADGFIDEGTDSFESPGKYEVDELDTNDDPISGGDSLFDTLTQYGPDDPGERETRPPYDAPLRGLEATLRVYERDSLQIREVKVRESFVPE